MKKLHFSTLSGRALLINLYATQGALLLLACILLLFQGERAKTLLALPPDPEPWLYGFGFAAAAAAANALLSRFSPGEAMRDPLVEKMFRGLPAWHIALLCLIIAFCEELLFRGAVQTWLGPVGAAVVFALLHARYLRHPLPAFFLLAVSLGLGWLLVRTGTLWAPLAAHFLFDFAAGLTIRYRRRTSSDESGT